MAEDRPRMILNFDGDLSEKVLDEIKDRFAEAIAEDRPITLHVTPVPPRVLWRAGRLSLTLKPRRTPSRKRYRWHRETCTGR